MDKRITLRVGEKINYYSEPYIVKRVYPYICYIENEKDGKEICVCIGDLVMAGVSPMAHAPSFSEVTYRKAPKPQPKRGQIDGMGYTYYAPTGGSY